MTECCAAICFSMLLSSFLVLVYASNTTDAPDSAPRRVFARSRPRYCVRKMCSRQRAVEQLAHRFHEVARRLQSVDDSRVTYSTRYNALSRSFGHCCFVVLACTFYLTATNCTVSSCHSVGMSLFSTIFNIRYLSNKIASILASCLGFVSLLPSICVRPVDVFTSHASPRLVFPVLPFPFQFDGVITLRAGQGGAGRVLNCSLLSEFHSCRLILQFHICRVHLVFASWPCVVRFGYRFLLELSTNYSHYRRGTSIALPMFACRVWYFVVVSLSTPIFRHSYGNSHSSISSLPSLKYSLLY